MISCSTTPTSVIASPRNESVAIQLNGLLRRYATNELMYVIAKEVSPTAAIHEK